jgi:hypothetical protein
MRQRGCGRPPVTPASCRSLAPAACVVLCMYYAFVKGCGTSMHAEYCAFADCLDSVVKHTSGKFAVTGRQLQDSWQVHL